MPVRGPQVRPCSQGWTGMSELDTHRIEVPVESDGVVYVFEGLDAEERHQDWALTGAATFDRIEPRP